jgi:hypothetical protein
MAFPRHCYSCPQRLCQSGEEKWKKPRLAGGESRRRSSLRRLCETSQRLAAAGAQLPAPPDAGLATGQGWGAGREPTPLPGSTIFPILHVIAPVGPERRNRSGRCSRDHSPEELLGLNPWEVSPLEANDGPSPWPADAPRQPLSLPIGHRLRPVGRSEPPGRPADAILAGCPTSDQPHSRRGLYPSTGPMAASYGFTAASRRLPAPPTQ